MNLDRYIAFIIYYIYIAKTIYLYLKTKTPYNLER
jgi:hypothetical protein